MRPAAMPFHPGVLQAEVQSFYADGGIALHTRSLKYGKVSMHSDTQIHPIMDPISSKNLFHEAGVILQGSVLELKIITIA